MDFHSSGLTLTAAQVAERLGLGRVQATLLAALAELDRPPQPTDPDYEERAPSGKLTLPETDALAALLAWLEVDPEDSVDLLRTIPDPEHDPERWWLLERCHTLLVRSLAKQTGGLAPLPPLPAALALFPAHLICASVDDIRRLHGGSGIPEDVSRETLSQLGRAMAAYRVSHGKAGILLTGWEWMRFSGLLYQIGRLEVIPYRLCTDPSAGPLFWYDEETAARLGAGFRKGDAALSVHVPATDPLSPAACDRSFALMRTAFAGVFPGETPRVATCTSWLLDDQLAEYLPADSNILAFQRRFDLVPGARDEDEALLRFVFGVPHAKELDELPQRTTLERAVVSHLRQGRHWRIRTGWLDLTK